MEETFYELESFKLFSESLIWQLNRDFYQNTGIDAWSKGMLPHQLTSSSMVGKTYAEIILGFLKDLAAKGQVTDTVYILELGAGHGRLAFHILKHLEHLIALIDIELPSYCYILSDIVEDNLSFFKHHEQLQDYLKQGVLDFAYFDAMGTKEIHLQYADTTIRSQDLNQPIIALANYFFDSIPNDVFVIKDQNMSVSSIALQSKENPEEVDTATLIKSLQLSYQNKAVSKAFYPNTTINDILEEYRFSLSNTHLFFPEKGLQCLSNLVDLSSKGLMVLSMDKGFHDIHDLENREEPDIIKHGSFSLWVNYHALGSFCLKKGGKVLFPSFSTFHAEVGCLLFLADADTYQYTNAAYQRFVNDFGPDDFNTLKKLTYSNILKLKLTEVIAFIRLSAYDSTFFIKLLPRLKQLSTSITFNERNRIAQTLHQVWHFYFNINEPDNLAFELAGFFYDLGFHEASLQYYQYAVDLSGLKADIYYNQILCYFQLRQDDLFTETLKEAKAAFPNNTNFEYLDKLDLAEV